MKHHLVVAAFLIGALIAVTYAVVEYHELVRYPFPNVSSKELLTGTFIKDGKTSCVLRSKGGRGGLQLNNVQRKDCSFSLVQRLKLGIKGIQVQRRLR